MYTVGLKRKCEAEHFLPRQKGAEAEKHSHEYTIEVKISGKELDDRGYLMDINELESVLDPLIRRLEEKPLNEQPEFEKTNPTVENFSRVVWEKLESGLDPRNISILRVKIWENEDAYASYSGEPES